jgi:DNA repair exonuclease SbcCD ATPase subunit/DNA repair exonuclease SbcCD nuclease subunit
MYEYIIHIADIHIRAGTETNSRYNEYLLVFENLKKSLLASNINDSNAIIVIAGDIFHNKNKVENFGLDLFKKLINFLTEIAITVIIPGNHDFLQQYPDDPSLLDSILLTNIKNLYYLNTTCTLTLNNIVISTISVKDTLIPGEGSGIIKDLPLFPKNFKDFKEGISTKVALFHGSFCKTYFNHNQQVDSNNSYPLEMLKGFDIGCLGDIHLHQEGVYDTCSYAYSGSLIQQNFGEDIIDHGYLIWDIKTKKSTHIPILNPYGFAVFKYNPNDNKWTIKYKNNFMEIESITCKPNFPKNISIRIDGTYNNIDQLYNILGKNNITVIDFKNIIGTSKPFQQHTEITKEKDTNYFKLYFKDTPIVSDYIDNPNKLLITTDIVLKNIIDKRNDKILQSIENYKEAIELDNKTTNNHSTFSLNTLEFDNCLCYGNNNKIIFEHFNNKSVIINAPNGCGKSALYEIICYAIYGEPMPSRQTKRFSASFVNSKSQKALTTISIKIDNTLYIIKRTYTTNVNNLRITDCSVSSESIKKPITGVKLIQKWLENNIGTIDDFLKSSMITQDFDFSFLSIDPKHIKKYIDTNINLNSIIKFKELIKEAYNASKDIIQHIDTAILQLNNNVIEVDFNEEITIDNIEKLNKKKEILYNSLPYIDYNKYPIEKIENTLSNTIDVSTLKSYDTLKNINIDNINNIDINKIKKYINIDFNDLQEKLNNLYNDKPFEPFNKKIKIPDNLNNIIKDNFNSIETVIMICNNYNNVSFMKTVKNTITINNLSQLESLKLEYETIMNNINDNNKNIQKLQKDVNILNNILHNLQPVSKPVMTILDAEEAIDNYNILHVKYPKKHKILLKYEKELEILEEKRINKKFKITLEKCHEYIKEFSKFEEQKEAYDIDIKLRDYKRQVKEYEEIEYNDKCDVCMKQSWVIKKLELEKQINILDNKLSYSILDINKWFSRYSYLKNNIDDYKDIIEQYNIEENIKEIKEKNIFEWFATYNILKENLKSYKDTINQTKEYNEYKINVSETSNKIKDILENLRTIEEINSILYDRKDIINNILNDINYTINKAYTLYEAYQLKKYNEWNEEIYNIKDILTFKPLVDNYNSSIQQIEDYRQLKIWNDYLYIEDVIKYRDDHLVRMKTLNVIKTIENEINELIIYKTNMITQCNIATKNKIEYDKLFNLQVDINKSINVFKIILDNYDNFQKWLYDIHILPNIISNVNNIIKHATINPFNINAFVDNEGIQFTLDKTSIIKASGFQKFIINIALRIAFLDLYNNKSSCSQLFIDEGWTSADANNRILIPKVLNYLLSKFNSVIIVSHIDEIKDIVDMSIKINKNNDKSHIIC